ncbi:hypothetical protein [Amphiplicatus metriothermophilus]|uniref:Uncharacterized protein n=1 Tax=Amphiplicatus metriothermophilus TaxID=1519374 RepID=A0A239PJ80_9PROT|nr:hypothetical protein [Amphiplicatus metriothermophilus]MBB5517830.1 hypothetical protein [Amphiplicatus metriothermophilus]SNT67836.1 hypothetical protein SAMN06297382_0329 [Amphiplicatus metriothermophilus]
MTNAFGRAIRIDGNGGLRSAAILAAAIYLALAQVLAVAHASSDEGMAPAHEQTSCAYHFVGDRSKHADATPLVLVEIEFRPPLQTPAPSAPAPAPRRASADPPPRAPPLG